MPQLGLEKIERISLPSGTPDDPAWVDLNLNFDAGTVLDATKGTDDPREIIARALVDLIAGWAYTGVDKKPAAVTYENIRRLPIQDFNVIGERVLQEIDSFDIEPVVETGEKKA